MTLSQRPIMLWMTSRSRSSMVSAIFAAHGIFWGDTQKQSAGYDTYENQTLKAIQIKYWGIPVMEPVSEDKKDNFIQDILKVVPKNEPWSMKTGIEFYPAYRDFNPYNIFITRKAEDVAKSLCQKRVNANYDEALKIIKWRFDYMEKIKEEDGGVFVDTDLIIAGDYSQIKEAIEYCGIEFDEDATKGAIK